MKCIAVTAVCSAVSWLDTVTLQTDSSYIIDVVISGHLPHWLHQ